MKVNKIHFLLLFIGIAIILSSYFALFVPIQIGQPIYYKLATDILNNNFAYSLMLKSNLTHLPFGYSALISGYIMNNIEITVRVVQFLSLVLIWMIVLYLYLNINSINKDIFELLLLFLVIY